MHFRPVQHGGNLWNPPTVDLEWPQIVRSVRVGNLCADPATFLVTQAPQRLFKPIPAAGRTLYAASDFGF